MMQNDIMLSGWIIFISNWTVSLTVINGINRSIIFKVFEFEKHGYGNEISY